MVLLFLSSFSRVASWIASDKILSLGKPKFSKNRPSQTPGEPLWSMEGATWPRSWLEACLMEKYMAVFVSDSTISKMIKSLSVVMRGMQSYWPAVHTATRTLGDPAGDERFTTTSWTLEQLHHLSWGDATADTNIIYLGYYSRRRIFPLNSTTQLLHDGTFSFKYSKIQCKNTSNEIVELSCDAGGRVKHLEGTNTLEKATRGCEGVAHSMKWFKTF